MRCHYCDRLDGHWAISHDGMVSSTACDDHAQQMLAAAVERKFTGEFTRGGGPGEGLLQFYEDGVWVIPYWHRGIEESSNDQPTRRKPRKTLAGGKVVKL